MRVFLLPLFLALCAPAVRSQSFNVDTGSALGAPSNTYAAAGLAGTWTQVNDGNGTVLKNLDGSNSSVSHSAFGFMWWFTYNNALTSGDDEQLLDDAFGFATTNTFTGLLDGDYDVRTYAWAPDNATYVTKVEVFQSTEGPKFVGGAWTGSHVEGVTYSVHRATVVGGQLGVLINNFTGPASLNGFQLEYLGAGCAAPSTYCTAKTTSSGCVPAIASTGSSTSGGGFTVTCTQVESSQLGVLFYSTSGNGNGQPFQGGFLCASPPVTRMGVSNAGGAGACNGNYSTSMDAVITSLALGTQVWSQYWFRDNFAASGTGLSNGLTFFVCP